MLKSVFPEIMGRRPVGIVKTEAHTKDGALPLTIFYPAEEGAEREQAEYAFSEALFGLPLWEERTRFLKEVPAAEGKFPIVFYNHGYASYEMSNSILCGDIAACGFIVVSIGHPGEATAVKLMDGTVIPMDEEFQKETYDVVKEEKLQAIIAEMIRTPFEEEKDMYFIEKGKIFCNIHEKNERMKIWVKQIQTAADLIIEYVKEKESPIRGKAELSCGFGLTGHSFGGAAAIEACREDARFTCGVDVDGCELDEHYGEDIGKPFMCIGNEITAKFLRGIHLKNTSDTYQVILDDVEHMGFTDVIFFPEAAAAMKIPLGKSKAEAVRKAVSGYHIWFFEKYLKKIASEKPGKQPGVRLIENRRNWGK